MQVPSQTPSELQHDEKQNAAAIDTAAALEATRVVETSTESLELEYKETVQTLRNWDTIFANWLSSLLIGGGVGAVASLMGKQVDLETLTFSFKIVFSAMVLVASFLGASYITYSLRVARPKKIILAEIERRLGMVGSYSQVGNRASQTVLVSIMVPLIVAALTLYAVWRMF